MAPVKTEFLWRNLICLRESLARINVPLHVRMRPRFDDIAADLLALCAELKCDAVFSNRVGSRARGYGNVYAELLLRKFSPQKIYGENKK